MQLGYLSSLVGEVFFRFRTMGILTRCCPKNEKFQIYPDDSPTGNGANNFHAVVISQTKVVGDDSSKNDLLNENRQGK